MIALPVFGYNGHNSIGHRYGFISAGEVTSAAHAEGRLLRHVIAENSSG
jgi:transposase, IS5 family